MGARFVVFVARIGYWDGPGAVAGYCALKPAYCPEWIEMSGVIPWRWIVPGKGCVPVVWGAASVR
jgi:hypothetical protein